MKLDLRGFQGYVKKTAAVESDDPANSRITLVVEGTVNPLIKVLPEKAVSFHGMPESLEEKAVDFVTNSKDFQISRIDDNLDGKAAYRLETMESGKHYRLRIANKVQHGAYRGTITLHTDNSEKPELTVWVSGSVEGEIGIRPKMLIVGKLAAGQDVVAGKVLVTSNRNKSFQIVKCAFDERVIAVNQSPLPNKSGFSLEVTPRMQNIPSGSRLQTTLTIETDAGSEEKQEVQVQAINLAEGPSGG